MTDTRFVKYVAAVLGLIVFGAFVVGVWTILIPFLLGLAISYLVYPLVDRFVAVGWRQDRVVLVLYLMLLGTGAVLTFFFLPDLIQQAQAIGRELPSYSQTIDAALEEINQWLSAGLSRLLGSRAPVVEIPFHADTFIEGTIANLPTRLHSVAHWGMWMLIVPFVSFFGLTQGRRWMDLVFQWTPSEYVESLLGLMAEINAALGGYARGLVLESLMVGLMTMVGLRVLGLNGFVFLGVVTGLLNIVPFMAPVVGGSLALLAGVFQGLHSSALFGIVGLYVAIRVLDDFVLIPFLIGHSVKLHPVLMLFAILSGFQIGGVLGLLFAIPVTAVVKVVLSVLMRSRHERLLLNSDHVHI